MHEAYGDFLGNAGACWWLAQPPWNAGCETLWGWAVARPCRAVPLPALCMGKCSGKARLSPASTSLQTFTTTQRLFCLGSGHPPMRAGQLVAALPVLPLSRFQPGQCPPMQDEASPGTARSWGGPCLAPRLVSAGGPGGPRCARPQPRRTPLPGGRPVQARSRRLLESGPSPNNGWRAGNAAWETGFGSAAAASHGPLAPFLSLLQRALPTAISHGAAPRGWGCRRPGGLGHEAPLNLGQKQARDTSCLG